MKQSGGMSFIIQSIVAQNGSAWLRADSLMTVSEKDGPPQRIKGLGCRPSTVSCMHFDRTKQENESCEQAKAIKSLTWMHSRLHCSN